MVSHGMGADDSTAAAVETDPPVEPGGPDVREVRSRGVAEYLDETMSRVEERTGTVDSLSVALLTALNLAREVLEQVAAGPLREEAERMLVRIETETADH